MNIPRKLVFSVRRIFADIFLTLKSLFVWIFLFADSQLFIIADHLILLRISFYKGELIGRAFYVLWMQPILVDLFHH